jgi:hypothetical protein
MMFSAFQTFGKLGALASSVARAWSPLALWPDGVNSPGMWISPSTLPASFNDSTGTTPVATPGSVADSANPVGLALDIRAGATALADPGNHMLQSTSAARPLESAYDGQTLGPGNTYDATGYPVFQLYDGVDDGMATASFAAGTLINGMDCMIAVRRDSASTTLVAGLYYQPGTSWTGFSSLDYPTAPVAGNAGSPAVWVDGVQLSGGTSVTAGTLHTALTTGSWHILEMRGLDLSTWTSLKYGDYVTAMLNGARGDILLYPSTASTADKDAARQYLADKYGVTLA